MPSSDKEDFSCRRCHLADEVRSFQTIRNSSLKECVLNLEPVHPTYIVPYIPTPPQTRMPLPNLMPKIVVFNILPFLLVFGWITVFNLTNFPHGLNAAVNGSLIGGVELAVLGVSITIIIWTSRIFTKRAKNTPEFLAWVRKTQELTESIERQRSELKKAAEQQYGEKTDRWKEAHDHWETLCKNLYCCERCARFFLPNHPKDVPAAEIERLLN